MATEIRMSLNQTIILMENVTEVECDVATGHEYSCLWATPHDPLTTTMTEILIHKISARV
jgi:hypothetical protein